MPEDLSASSFCKDRFCKNGIDPKIRVPSVPSVPRYGKYTWYTYFSVRFAFFFQGCPQITIFLALKINGGENRKDSHHRTKPFHEIMLLWTMYPVHGTMGVFAVTDQTTRNSKVGYGHIWTGHHKRNSERISEIADFLLFGTSISL